MNLKINKRWNFLNLIKAFFLLLFTVKCVESKNEGLYNKNDDIVILTVNNFQSYVYNSNSSWLIEFYAHWCGHCIRFAPIWKSFAKNVRHLNSIVRIAAVDCANDANYPVCSKNQVTGYPTLKFFSANSKPGYQGSIVETETDVVSLQKKLLNILETEKREGRGNLWPNIIPYSGNDLKNIWQTVGKNVKYLILIFETSKSIVGTSAILHFQNISNLHIGRVLTYKPGFLKLHFLQRHGSPMAIDIKNLTNDKVQKLIYDKLQSFGVSIKMTEMTGNHSETNNVPNNQSLNSNTSQFGDVLFQLDLEKTLRYSLDHEISLSKSIDGEKMTALKNYLDILASYFPMQANGTVYLLSLKEAVKDKRNITGKTFRYYSSNIKNRLSSVYSGSDKWIGCRGSSNIYRGYPCGLWTMFHMLTVNYANVFQKGQDPGKILRAMHGYIKNFFGCAECSRHFLEMADRNHIFQVKNVNDSILWLWRAHNEVNRKLAGDATEDPEHKKIQYPSKHDCPSCRDGNNNWIESNVLLYLKKKYSSQGVNFYGSNLKSKKLYYHSSPKNISSYLFYNRK